MQHLTNLDYLLLLYISIKKTLEHNIYVYIWYDSQQFSQIRYGKLLKPFTMLNKGENS